MILNRLALTVVENGSLGVRQLRQCNTASLDWLHRWSYKSKTQRDEETSVPSHLLPLHPSSSRTQFGMAFQTLFALATLAASVVAAPSPQANCGGGRFVRNAAVRSFSVCCSSRVVC